MLTSVIPPLLPGRGSARPLLLAICALILATAGCEAPPPERAEAIRPVRLFTVGEGAIMSAREVYGTARASRSADVSFRVGGRIEELAVAPGQIVAEGDLLARLESRDLANRVAQRASELDGARSVLAQMQAGARAEDIRRLEALVAARASERDEAAGALVRAEQLAAEGVLARSEYDKVKARAEVASSSHEVARQELEAARSGARAEEVAAQEATIRGLEARLQEARDALADAELRAPFGGVVARTAAKSFEDVQANQPIATLQDISRIDVVIHVGEDDVARARVRPSGDAVVAFGTFPALGDARYPLSLKEFQTEADPTTQTFEVVLQMVQSGGFPVKPGMNVVVTGEGGAAGAAEGSGWYMVPLKAIVAQEDGTKGVWVVDPQTRRVARRAVQTGKIVNDQVQVVSGLSAGEVIAATAVNLLREGTLVEQLKEPGSL